MPSASPLPFSAAGAPGEEARTIAFSAGGGGMVRAFPSCEPAAHRDSAALPAVFDGTGGDFDSRGAAEALDGFASRPPDAPAERLERITPEFHYSQRQKLRTQPGSRQTLRLDSFPASPARDIPSHMEHRRQPHLPSPGRRVQPDLPGRYGVCQNAANQRLRWGRSEI